MEATFGTDWETKMTEQKFFAIIMVYVLLNVLLFAVYKLTRKLKPLHRTLAILDNLLFALLVGYGFYRMNPLLVILLPCVLLIVYPISWGLNRELSDEDLALLVHFHSVFPMKEADRMKAKVGFAHLATFPFYYLLDSWSKV